MREVLDVVKLMDVRVVDGYLFRSKAVEVLNGYFEKLDDYMEHLEPMFDFCSCRYKRAYDYLLKLRMIVNFLYETQAISSSVWFDLHECLDSKLLVLNGNDLQEGDKEK